MAKLAYDKLREEDSTSDVFIGINVRNTEQTPHETNIPFVFSDGTEFDEDDFLKWTDNTPEYKGDLKCTLLLDGKVLGKIGDALCDAKGKALCYLGCTSSASELSRANLPLFAIFVAGGVFNTALPALVF